MVELQLQSNIEQSSVFLTETRTQKMKYQKKKKYFVSLTFVSEGKPGWKTRNQLV